MFFAVNQGTHLTIQQADFNDQALLANTYWIDLYNPTPEQLKEAEQFLAISIPSRQQMNDIELSSRLIIEGSLLQMTCSLVSELDVRQPEIQPVTFILTTNKLITVRYDNFKGFQLFEANLQQQHDFNSISLLLLLLDALIEKRADGIEQLDSALDLYAKKVFHIPERKLTQKQDYRHLMITLGANGDSVSKNSRSLISLRRLITFLSENAPNMQHSHEVHCRSMQKDLTALCDHADFLANDISFLLNATLGMINIEQNNIIKIFSMVAVVLMPPTLIADIYGMNFHFIPELSFKYGYYCALVGMMISAWLPYRYFKKKRWL